MYCNRRLTVMDIGAEGCEIRVPCLHGYLQPDATTSSYDTSKHSWPLRGLQKVCARRTHMHKKGPLKETGSSEKEKTMAARDAGRVIPPHPYCACTRRTSTTTQIAMPSSKKSTFNAGLRHAEVGAPLLFAGRCSRLCKPWQALQPVCRVAVV